jgi:hypothetical protein
MYACEWCIYAYRIGVYVLKLCHYWVVREVGQVNIHVHVYTCTFIQIHMHIHSDTHVYIRQPLCDREGIRRRGESDTTCMCTWIKTHRKKYTHMRPCTCTYYLYVYIHTYHTCTFTNTNSSYGYKYKYTHK